MKRGIQKELDKAYENVKREMRHDGSKYAAGMASEGWSGGYASAMQDVQLALRGVKPNTRGYWDGWEYKG